jgi:two-component system OmpR family response regulator
MAASAGLGGSDIVAEVSAKHVLIVDDERRIREVLEYALDKDGYRVTSAADGAEALAAFERDPPDLVVLDVMLPDLDGLELCRRLRKRGATPVLFLSARGDEVDRIVGLEVGGDDYLTKPFSTRELLARVRAVLRRFQASEERSEPAPSLLRHGKLELDRERFEARVDGSPVALTVTEFSLLAALLERPGRRADARPTDATRVRRRRLGHGAHAGHARPAHPRQIPQSFAGSDHDGPRSRLQGRRFVKEREGGKDGGAGRLWQFFGRIRVRLLAVNLLVVLIPAAGLEFARIYERQLLDGLERDMVNQAVLLRTLVEDALAANAPVEEPRLEQLVSRAARQTRTRVRLVTPAAGVVVDSHRFGPPEGKEPRPNLLGRSLSSSSEVADYRGEREPETPIPKRTELATAFKGSRATRTPRRGQSAGRVPVPGRADPKRRRSLRRDLPDALDHARAGRAPPHSPRLDRRAGGRRRARGHHDPGVGLDDLQAARASSCSRHGALPRATWPWRCRAGAAASSANSASPSAK